MLPNDFFVLLSWCNTKLRDGDSLDDLCAQSDVEKDVLLARFEQEGYFFDEENGAFRPR